MQKMSRLKISTKLALGFGAMALLIMILAAFALMRIYSIEAVVESQNRTRAEKLEQLYSAREALDQTGIAARNAFIFTSEADANRELDILDQQKALYLAALNAMTPAFKGEADFEKARKGLLAMAEELNRPRKYRSEGKMEEYGVFLVKECSPLRRQIVADIDVVVKSVQRNVDAQSQQAAAAVSQSVRIILMVGALALLVAVIVGILMTRSLLRQLGGEPGDVADIARRVAQGDLAVRVITSAGDQNSVMAAMKDMRDSLVGIVAQVRAGTQSISTASGEIAAGNMDLSSRTEQQASSLEETASSMEELTSTVRQNADNARAGNDVAIAASAVAIRGGAVMSQVVDTMGSINESARKIADIIGVIDSIAFQTNILALNAAVEAARAGEQGRGFAVVATEVRTLAQKSAAAAREIKSLIGDSVERIDTGSKLVTEAGATMEEIVDSVKRVTAIMGEILVASQEQSAGIEQVNRAIGQMDDVTQQNAALVEQAAAAAGSLREQTGSLSQAVSVFRLDGAAPTSLTAPGKKPATAITPSLIANRKPSTTANVRSLATTSSKVAARDAGNWEEF
ncbi:methyl-accepting chemotaxis protein [Noviherbaspirillum suwonense]|uniref:Methyl-accepting chemotaxis protein n=2 Tax=Noviherbaspirillum suwonense TaxID=1224511 RepID=A0ABY1QTN8_9BURK|nr:methyl-accepting chemotaxis protein [Noviherbaspirillum suwonense]SMP80118.1 methyl-accepting chemotaxis protein [Noviherbaspirillum suwonense]